MSAEWPLRIHELKTWPEFFEAVRDGRKPFEIRQNDRAFAVWDRLCLREYKPELGTYTGREVWADVTYLTDAWQRVGYVVMGLRVVYHAQRTVEPAAEPQGDR